MARLIWSGFDFSDNAKQFPFVEPPASGLSVAAPGRYSYGRQLRANSSSPSFLNVGAAVTELIFEADFLAVNLDPSSGAKGFLEFRSSDGATHLFLAIQSPLVAGFGKVEVRNSAGTVLGSESGHSIPQGAWVHIGFRMLISDTVGEAEVRIDGNATPVINLTNQDTKNNAGLADVQLFRVRRPGFSGDFNIDNMIAMDTTGGADDDFKGPARVFFGMPSADGTVAWSPNSGSLNWDRVDEVPPDEDSTYVSAASAALVDALDVPTWTGVLSATADIPGAKVTLLARRDDVGSPTVRPALRIASTKYTNSTAVAIPDAYYDPDSGIEAYFDADPSDAGAWTIAKLNATDWGYERVA